MKFEKWEVFNLENAIRGMRNPMDSWDKSDSKIKYNCYEDGRWVDKSCTYDGCCHSCWFEEKFFIGKNDLELARKLIKAGGEHRKFLRQIIVSVDITAPRYWWTEFDTYKVGTVANSCSTMHRLTSKPITIDDFEMNDFEDVNPFEVFGRNREDGSAYTFELYLTFLEELRLAYLHTKDKRYWKELIRLLPQSYLQKRTVTLNYEVLYNMYRQRKSHKLTEWNTYFVNWVKELPYAREFILLED